MQLTGLEFLSPEDLQRVKVVIEAERQAWRASLTPDHNEFGMRMLPRDPNDPSRFLPVFHTEKHTYKILTESGIGIARYTQFQKMSIVRGFARDFGSIHSKLEQIKLLIAGEQQVGKMRSDAIIQLHALIEGVSDFSKEQFDSGLWLCSLFVLREDEKVSVYDEAIAEEKIRDWADYGYSEIDFFLLSAGQVPGYAAAFQRILQDSQAAKERLWKAWAGSATNSGRASTGE